MSASSQTSVFLRFRAGTIELRGLEEAERVVPGLRWDKRSASYRAPARAYRDVVAALTRAGRQFVDEARAYPDLVLERVALRAPRPYQTAALDAWNRHGGGGVVVLPTGAGKTQVALMAIARKARATLVVAPTLDLVWQWHDVLRTAFGGDVGVVGGGDHDVRPLTVTTYDSAHLHMEHLGSRFGMLVFDECHHLPGPSYRMAAELSLAPFRLGLSATPDARDGDVDVLTELIGPVVYREEVDALAGEYLADYDVERLEVSLTDEERAQYEAAREEYLLFLRANALRVATPAGWQRFIQIAARSDDGRRALAAHRTQKRLVEAAPAKLEVVERLLLEHRASRSLIFTQDNATAHAISRRALIPVITHQTKVSERSAILNGLRDGTYNAVVTSRVLNEGIDIPDADVAIVVSGTGSVREHVQRLGRILRHRDGKRAILYELVTRDTSEMQTSARRREHRAYQ